MTKTVEDGVLYDTEAESATMVASRCPVADRQDFRFLREELYRTDSGRWFLFGEGGPMTTYSRSVGTGETAGGEEITGMTADEARQWLQKHDKTEALLDHFGDEIETA